MRFSPGSKYHLWLWSIVFSTHRSELSTSFFLSLLSSSCIWESWIMLLLEQNQYARLDIYSYFGFWPTKPISICYDGSLKMSFRRTLLGLREKTQAEIVLRTGGDMLTRANPVEMSMCIAPPSGAELCSDTCDRWKTYKDIDQTNTLDFKVTQYN